MRTKIKGRASTKDAVIGKKLREIRHWRSLSQKELAAKVSVTFQQIQKYENGTNRISAGRLHDLSQILQVDINDFLWIWNAEPRAIMLCQSSQAKNLSS